jgi:hypothetical protein
MDDTDIKQRKINLKINGRLFPSFVDKNYKKFIIPPDEIIKGVDPCNNLELKREKQELKKYQEFVSKYMDFESNNQSIFLYHATGTGKTRTIITIYEMLYRNNPNYNMFFIIKAGLKKGLLIEFEKWIKDKDIYKNIIIVHLDSPQFGVDFERKKRESDSAKKNVYFIDEVHLFISHVLSNMNSEKKSENSLSVYQTILQDKIENDCKIILSTATPCSNKPFELALLFNLLRPNIFPNNQLKFEKMFIEQKNGVEILNPIMKNSFQRRIMGLVSYYMPESDLYATKTTISVEVSMSEYQTDIYKYYEKIEHDILRKSSISFQSPLYRIYTRECANFVFPNINNTINAQNRPRPSQFKISEEEYEKLLNTNKENKKNITNMDAYFKMLHLYETETEKYFDTIFEKDKLSKHNINTDIENFKKYENFNDFMIGEKTKSKLFIELFNCSCKYMNMIFNISKAKNPVMIYTQFIVMGGIHMIKIYLKYFGYLSYSDKNAKDFYKYGEMTGEISSDEREKVLKIQQDIENKNGKLLKIIFFSKAGSEGISLYNITQEHILEPFWSESTIIQVSGRGIRMCSHKNLPMDERHVTIFRYKSVKNNLNKKQVEKDGKLTIEESVIVDENLLKTVDYDVELKARNKYNLLESFYEPIKEVAIDCNLFKNHNMVNSKYKCFKFNQNSLFEKNIGPAYKEDLLEDLKIDNGLNSTKSIVVKVKVIKIKGIVDNIISSYWYDTKSGVVYDYELHYPVGKVAKINGIPEKIDIDTYKLDVINIPTLS